MKNIQFIGTQRSGSNLLRVMLHQSPEISAPHPPHMLQYFFPILPMYGDISEKKNFEILVKDVIELVHRNPVDWQLSLKPQEVISRCQKPSLVQIAKAIYELKALKKGASIWCCKSMANIHFAMEIEEAGVHPFYLYLVRDGRDVAASFRRAIIGEKHIFQLADQWNEDQLLSKAIINGIGKDRHLVVHYEKLIKNPEKILRQICERLEIAFVPEMLDYYHSSESKETASSGAMWQNLTQPILKSNTKKYESVFSEAEMRIFERVAGQSLLDNRYSVKYKNELQLPPFSVAEVTAFERENAEMKKAARLNAPKEDLEKRAAQDAFLKELKDRYEKYLLSVWG